MGDSELAYSIRLSWLYSRSLIRRLESRGQFRSHTESKQRDGDSQVVWNSASSRRVLVCRNGIVVQTNLQVSALMLANFFGEVTGRKMSWFYLAKRRFLFAYLLCHRASRAEAAARREVQRAGHRSGDYRELLLFFDQSRQRSKQSMSVRM